MRTIWLIRHAESRGNAGERTELPQSIALTELGYQQANELSKYLPKAPDLIVVSRYQRTVETAHPTMQRFPDSPVVEWPIHEFTFLAPEQYRGKTQDERRGPALEFWERCEPAYCDGGDAESFDSFMFRIRDCLDRLRKGSANFTTVFTHGYVIKAILWDLLYFGNRNPLPFMRGFQQFHHSFPVKNGMILPILANEYGELFVGSPSAALRTKESPPAGDRLD